jgi:CRISPR-associated protein Cmr6
MRPLYRQIGRPELGRAGNAGLWYDKYCDKWSTDWSKLETKADWLSTVTGERVGEGPLLVEHSARQRDLVAARGGICILVETEGRFVSGLGRNHPVENGFTWHHALGVPYLAGPSVKGMVRAWARDWCAAEAPEIARLFGPESEANVHAAGSMLFPDALPVDPVKLEADVMTPHYGPYYSSAGAELPGDWHSPIPVPFLTVAAQQRFQFAVMPRSRADEDVETVATWLTAALCELGAGAKTAAGYGRFVSVGIVASGADAAPAPPVIGARGFYEGMPVRVLEITANGCLLVSYDDDDGEPEEIGVLEFVPRL